MTRNSPRVSVILPIGDPRFRIEYLNSWIKDQQCDPRGYEVIVVTREASDKVNRMIQTGLREHDTCITVTGNRFSKYDDGARSAKSDWILLSEDHCVADPDCVSEAVKFIGSHPEIVSATLNPGHINPGRLAELEQALFEVNDEDYWSKEDHWDKVRARGFLIRKDVYFQHGGMGDRYRYFAEPLLSTRLHNAGIKTVHIPGATVSHVNNSRFRLMFHDVNEYVSGECEYRDEGDTLYCERYFGLPKEWIERKHYNRRNALKDTRMLWRLVRSCSDRNGIGVQVPIYRELFFRYAILLFSIQGMIIGSRITLAYKQALYYLRFFNRDIQLESYRDIWFEFGRLTRLRYIAANESRIVCLLPGSDQTIFASRLDSMNSQGFHVLEEWNGVEFRWSSPVSSIAVDLSRGNYIMVIDTANLRGRNCDFPLVISWNNKIFGSSEFEIQDGRIHLEVEEETFSQAGEQTIRIVAAPVPERANEIRKLGIPIRSIKFLRRQERGIT